MAACTVFTRQGARFLTKITACRSLAAVRCQSTTTQSDENEKEKPSGVTSKGWLANMLGGGASTVDTTKVAHSSMLSEKRSVYELQTHRVKPEFMEEYLNQFGKFVNLMHEKGKGAQLAGSWTVEVGDQDEAIHLWHYPGGYPQLNESTAIYRTDQEFIDFRLKRNKMLRSRHNQILLPFSFWGDIQNREGPNIYELRSYTLKPGTMIEWGNNWARGLKFRQNSRPVGGFFSQIGEMNMVHHIWSYESLQSRKEVRQNAWKRPGWDECVRYTVPLIRHMTARILIPTPFSPLK